MSTKILKNYQHSLRCAQEFLQGIKDNFHLLNVEEKNYLGNLVKTYRQEKKPYDWSLLGRPQQQLPQGSWRTWLIMAGRGFGKTRTGAQSIRQWIQEKKCSHIAFIGNTLEDVKNIMVQGSSGLLSCCAPWEHVEFSPSKNQVLFPCGAKISFFSSKCPEKLRGPQFDGAWIDELAKFSDPQALWDQLSLSLRLGQDPRVIVTTTPKPLKFLEYLMNLPSTVVTKGTTMDNAQNLSPGFLTYLQDSYGGTALWQQEVCGQLLPPNADESLWRPDLFRYKEAPQDFEKIVIALDPAVTAGKNSDETGLIVGGLNSQGEAYILEDLSGTMTPQSWAKATWIAWTKYKDRCVHLSVVAEVNNGGDIVGEFLKNLYPMIPYSSLRATTSKILRAQPALRLYEQGKVFHTRAFSELEAQMLYPQRFSSPDRMDALVWCLHKLLPPKKHTLDFL